MLSLPGYAITSKLYEGRKSVVYRGLRHSDGAPVVVKVLRSDYPAQRDLARVHHEYRVNQRLQSHGASGIIRSLALERYGNGLATVQEDIGGLSLKGLIEEGRLNLEEALRIAMKVASALSEIHAADVIHKDIKPQNIIVHRATGEVRITDFGVSTQLTREQQKLISPSRLEGTLAYMAPEQTGRMNRPLDYRCDLYSVGATFYELLTGRRPFMSTDAMELVHSHIAREPTPPHELDPTIPEVLSRIVLKLMAKTADDRYQSASGLHRDLSRCLEQLQERGGIQPFDIGQDDVYERFVLPQKLYGREDEVHDLLMAFERVADGRSESLYVSGYSGAGKTALVSEVKRPIVRRRGYFVSGKIDQHQRSVPYSAFIQAFGELVRQILTEPDARVAAWREEVLEALGDSGGVLTEVVPDIELLIGKQGHAAELSAAEANNRFNSLFTDFVKVFASADHPLVIFLDDLQWADTASLKLLQRLAAAPDVEYLLLIGAYRDNEVSIDHPLMVNIDEIERAGGTVTRMHLEGLGLPHLDELVGDALHCSPTRARPLAQLLQQKTGGNPFFLNEFLRALYTERMIRHDSRSGWTWDVDAIASQGFTTNVVEMMTGRITRLGEATQDVLATAACVGNRFDLRTLAKVTGALQAKTSLALWPAVHEGLVAPVDDTWKLVAALSGDVTDTALTEFDAVFSFVHDRVQQAAYELRPAEERVAVHLKIGRALLGDRSLEPLDEQVFEICNHFGYGIDQITDPAERYRIAKLCYIAGKKAKRSAAYEPAIAYFRSGMQLLGDTMWQDSEGMSMGLAFNLSECVYLIGEHDEAERLFDDVLAHCTTDLERASVYNLKVVLYSNQTRYAEAIACGVQALECCGVSFPAEVKQWHVLLEVVRCKWQLRGRSVESLEFLDELAEPRLVVAIRVLNAMAGPAFFHDPNLYSVLVLKMLHMSLLHGNSDVSSFSYAMYGMICGSVLGDFESGMKFGELAMRLQSRYGNPDVVAKVHMIVGNFVNPWRNPVRSNFEYLSNGYKEGRVAGDLIYTGYCGLTQVYAMLTYGEQLDHFFRESHKFLEFLKRTGDEDSADCIVVMQRMVLCLQGLTSERGDFSDDGFDEVGFKARLEAKDMKIPIALYHIAKMRTGYVYGQFAQVVEHADAADAHTDAIIGMPWGADLEFLGALATLRLPTDAPGYRKRLSRARKSLKRLRKWGANAPSNFLQKVELLRAEFARVQGDTATAMNAYEVAMAMARKNGFLHDEALACELSGRFNHDLGRSRIARSYLLDARYAYQRWGASEKVAVLDSEWPDLKHAADTASGSTSTTLTMSEESTSSAHGAFDFLSVMKASQAISSEIVLEKLLPLLLNVVIENAGARRGLMLLERDGKLLVEAEGTAQSDRYEVLQGRAIDGRDDLSASVVNYVARTRESIVLHDASEDGRFANDPYILRHRPRSVLAAPVTHASDLIGVLYLENNLNSGVFTKDRIEVIQMLSSQIAISIENASLYARQEEMASSLARFVPTEFLEVLGKPSIVNVQLGDAVEREMTVMFSDIRSFTAMSEQMTPEENFTFLNSYLRRVGPVIRQHKGFIDKYIGDAIMALYPHRPEDAIDAAVAMQRQARAFNVERSATGAPPLAIGVGLHIGQLMLGTIGEERRLEGTVIADAVNIAARLEGLTKAFGVGVVVSESTLTSATSESGYRSRFLGEVTLRGRVEAIPVHEVFDCDEAHVIAHKERTRAVFESGVRAWITDDVDKAEAAMAEVLASWDGDSAARYYQRQIRDTRAPTPRRRKSQVTTFGPN